MAEFIELHEVGSGLPITVRPQSVVCVEPVTDESGNVIGTMVALCGIKESWVSVKESYEEVKDLLEWKPSINEKELIGYLLKIKEREIANLERLDIPVEEAEWHKGYKACIEDQLRELCLPDELRGNKGE